VCALRAFSGNFRGFLLIAFLSASALIICTIDFNTLTEVKPDAALWVGKVSLDYLKFIAESNNVPGRVWENIIISRPSPQKETL
jgi:hypothetical protein